MCLVCMAKESCTHWIVMYFLRGGLDESYFSRRHYGLTKSPWIQLQMITTNIVNFQWKNQESRAKNINPLWELFILEQKTEEHLPGRSLVLSINFDDFQEIWIQGIKMSMVQHNSGFVTTWTCFSSHTSRTEDSNYTLLVASATRELESWGEVTNYRHHSFAMS